MYEMSEESKKAFDNYWPNWDQEKGWMTPANPQFPRVMIALQQELIFAHYPKMDAETKARAEKTVKYLSTFL